MTDTKNLMDELRSIVEDIATLTQEQGRVLEEKWGGEDVPTDDLAEYDDICHDHLVEESDLLVDVQCRLIELLEPKAVA
ncbi:hypothetical protein ACQEVX_23195 [Streptomyces syringium]|uniref:hypothetical protein n=1 Tax=Streptomyces syringium TaxID=76729 RepID=UPI003D90D511